MKKKAFLSFEEDLEHHKQFIRHFEKRIEPILTKGKEKFLLDEQLTIFQRMYEWMIKHLQKFKDNAYECLTKEKLTTELLSNFLEKQKEHSQEANIQMETTELLFLQLFIKVHNFFDIQAKNDHFQSTMMYILAKKLIGYQIKSFQDMASALFALMITQDTLKKTSFFFPEVIICLERVVFFFIDEIQEKGLAFDESLLDANDKSINQRDFLNVYKHIFEGKLADNDVSANTVLYKTVDKLMGSYLILFGSDPNCDITLANLWNIVQGIKDEKLKAYSESTFNKLKNLVEKTREKFDMNIIKDKPLIRIKQLTPKIEDTDEEADRDYEEEVKKERKILKKAVTRESKRVMKELAYDSMVLQMEKDKEKEKQDGKKKATFKKFVKFVEEQKLEGKRIQTTQLQHKQRHKVKKVRLAGNQTDPRSGNSGN